MIGKAELNQGFELERTLFADWANTTTATRKVIRAAFASGLRDIGFDDVTHYHSVVKELGLSERTIHIIECSYLDVEATQKTVVKNGIDAAVYVIPNTRIVYCKDANQLSTFDSSTLSEKSIIPVFTGVHSSFLNEPYNPGFQFMLKKPLSIVELSNKILSTLQTRLSKFTSIDANNFIKVATTETSDRIFMSVGVGVKPFDSITSTLLCSSETCITELSALETLENKQIDGSSFIVKFLVDVCNSFNAEVIFG